MIKTCVICKAEFNAAKKKIKCCSNACGQKLRSKNALAQFSKEELHRLYWEENLSFRQISKKIGKSPRQIRSYFKKYNIPCRKGSEAIKQQWHNNAKRRKEFSNLMSTGDERTKLYKKIMYKKRHLHNKWRQSVLKRDNFTCVCCNERKNRMQAHHLANIVDFAEHRFNPDNGITVCCRCHCRIHKNLINLDYLPQVHQKWLALEQSSNLHQPKSDD